MAAHKLLLGFFLCLLATTALATTHSTRRGDSTAEKCLLLQNYTIPQPTQRSDYEGGFLEQWDMNDPQFPCIGATPVRRTMYPNTLSLFSYHPFTRLVYVVKGTGVVGVQLPGCPKPFQTGVDPNGTFYPFGEGDIIVIPSGGVHWGINTGNEDMVNVIINDLNNPSNLLGFTSSEFHLAGAGPSQTGQSFDFLNIFSGFKTDLLDDAFDIDPEIVKAMQKPDERGLLVNFTSPIQLITRGEQLQGYVQERESSNGLEEIDCNAKIIYSLGSQEQPDVITPGAGELNYLNVDKLPILSDIGLGAEKGTLLPNALIAPSWSVNSHTLVYVLKGDAHVQTVSSSGETAFDEIVKEGDFYVVPQNFPTITRAGENGFEWMAFKTSKSPLRTPLAGQTSVFRALPVEVLTNAYEITVDQALSLKTNRETENILLSPKTTIQSS